MSRSPRHLRTRLAAAMVAVALAVLVVTAAGAEVLARRSARDAAVADARGRAGDVADLVEQYALVATRQPSTVVSVARLRRALGSLLAASDASVATVLPDGTVAAGVAPLFPATTSAPGVPPTELPADLRPAGLDYRRLAEGRKQSGVDGDTAYAAVPLGAVRVGTPVVIVRQAVGGGVLDRAGGYLAVVVAVTFVVAIGVSAWLARRLTRRVAAMQAVAGRLAAGDLTARAGADPALRTGPDDELADLARSLDAMAGELETARGHERAFLLSVSHDLRTPLTSIRGYAEAIADGTVTGEATGDAARTVLAEARRLERLVGDLLDLARLDARAFSCTPVPCDARSVVAATVAGFAPIARDWSITLDVDPVEPQTAVGEAHADAVAATLDPERLAQIVANLVENALKFAATRVTVSTTRDGGAVLVRVDDDGPGIPESERARVFERLHTARGGAGRSVGTGVGLAIVAELAAAMGGTASCGAPPGGGARFEVRVTG